eukprot:m.19230 g.19230  ORF g.19230 m.19230 type:complete len:88 (-) comp8643_c0_seq2:163-426(-)
MYMYVLYVYISLHARLQPISSPQVAGLEPERKETLNFIGRPFVESMDRQYLLSQQQSVSQSSAIAASDRSVTLYWSEEEDADDEIMT